MFLAQNILLKAQRDLFPAEKGSHLAEVNLGPNLGDAVLHLRYRVHQQVVAAPGLSGIVYCLFFVIVILCPPKHCGCAIRNMHVGVFF